MTKQSVVEPMGDVLAITPMSYAQPQVGQIVRVDAQGVWVYVPQQATHAVLARSTIALNAAQTSLTGASVVLVFENGDATLPIIIGLLNAPSVAQEMTVVRDGQHKRVVIDAQTELELRCGRSSIVLQADGKITLKGEHIVSRARQSNKIKGGNVLLN